MNGFPPPILVSTWIYLANNNNPEIEHIKSSVQERLDRVFGSVEIATLYIEHCSSVLT